MERYPEVLPVLPLTRSLLLPGTLILVHAMEPGHLRLVADVVAGDGHLGLIQPVEEEPESPDRARLYDVGCLGHVEQCQERSGGGCALLVKGLLRFRCQGELPRRHGYRRVHARYDSFLGDLDEPWSDREFARLRDELRQRIETQNKTFDLSILDRVAGVDIVNGLSQAFPMSTAERQALLEAPSLGERQELLLTLMQMGFARLDPYASERPS